MNSDAWAEYDPGYVLVNPSDLSDDTAVELLIPGVNVPWDDDVRAVPWAMVAFGPVVPTNCEHRHVDFVYVQQMTWN